MGLISASLEQLAMVGETAWGTIPATPGFQILRFVPPATFNGNVETVKSGEKRSDRNPTDSIIIGSGAAGSLNFELSYGTYDALLAAVLCNDWDSDVLKNGVEMKSFAFERKIPTGSSTADYYRYTGMRLNGFSLACRAKEIVTGSFDLMGKAEAYADAALAGATYADPTTTGVINAASDFASLNLGSVAGVHILSLDMNVENGLASHYAVGDKTPLGVTFGDFVVSGNMEVYYENSTVYKKFIDGAAVDLSFTLGSVTGEKYSFEVPRLKFTSGDMPLAGGDEPIKITLGWEGLYDETAECTMMVTRGVA